MRPLRSTGVTPFAAATAVHRVGAGSYRTMLDESWNLRPLPQGGIITAIALRAMEAELGNPAQTLRTLHTVFVGQVTHGELEVRVEVLRTGRSMSHLRAEVRNLGAAAGHITTAVFGASREGFEFTHLQRPVVPPPEACRSFRTPPPPGFPAFRPLPFWTDQVPGRGAIGVAPWGQVAERTAEQAIWYEFDHTPWIDDGARLDPYSLVVLADTMPGAVSQRIGPTDRMWFGPSVDLTVHLCADCRSPQVLAHNIARWAGDGYASIDMALWDDDRLVAYGTQVAFFTFPEV